MTTHDTTRRLTFYSARRAGASYYGNPAWDVTFYSDSDDRHMPVETFRTSSNTGWSYEVSGLRNGDILDVTFTRAGRIRFAGKVK